MALAQRTSPRKLEMTDPFPIHTHASSPPQPCSASFRFRRWDEADLLAVQTIDQLSFSLPWPTSAFHYEFFENEQALLWLAERVPDGLVDQPMPEASTIVGFVVMWMILDEGHVATIAVHPDWRRCGIAAELLSLSLQDAIAHGAVCSTLEVRQSNASAQALYARFGFKEVGRRRRYYRDNQEDALILTVDGLDDTYQHWLASGNWRRWGWSQRRIFGEDTPGEDKPGKDAPTPPVLGKSFGGPSPQEQIKQG